MNVSGISKSTVSPDFMMRYAMQRIHQLEAELRKLQSRSETVSQYVKIFQSNRLIRVPAHEILFIKSESNYSRIYLKNGAQYFTSKTLKAWIEEIGNQNFLRCHRSYFVNKEEIAQFDQLMHNIVLNNNEVIPVSRKYHKTCRSIFSNNQTAVFEINRKCTVHKLSLKRN